VLSVDIRLMVVFAMGKERMGVMDQEGSAKPIYRYQDFDFAGR
jgi:hypothetical protein